MIKKLWMMIVSVTFLACSFLIYPASADTLNPTYDEVIEPKGYDAVPLPGTSGFDVKITITSDIPVDMYVVTQEQLTSYEVSLTFNGYEERYLDTTSKSFTYSGSGAGSDWVLIVNDDPSLTANVHIEFKVLQEVGEGAAKACCGSSMFLGIASLVAIVSILYVLKRR